MAGGERIPLFTLKSRQAAARGEVDVAGHARPLEQVFHRGPLAGKRLCAAVGELYDLQLWRGRETARWAGLILPPSSRDEQYRAALDAASDVRNQRSRSTRCKVKGESNQGK